MRDSGIKRGCLKCLIADLPQGEKLRQILTERLEQISEEERTGSAEYTMRLECCRKCGELHEGTCAQCGCYVELWAARKGKSCPENRWN